MNDEKIKVKATSSGQLIEVLVLNKRLDAIEVDRKGAAPGPHDSAYLWEEFLDAAGGGA